ncbi:MAG TPA: hypothetical protein VJX67_17915 [Blastocatellia bacterium]|nr:hypothetical protein [Blastocatellia bacterium]
MSGSARSLFIFGIYSILLGTTLMVDPNFLLGVFGIAHTTEPWIRVAGMLLFALGIYYVLGGHRGLTDFIRWSVYTRSSVVFFFITFVLLHLAPPVLILLGCVDLAAAIWTGVALKSEGKL